MSVSSHRRLLLAPPIITLVYITATDLCVLLVYTSYSLFLASSRKWVLWKYLIEENNFTGISLGSAFRQIRKKATATKTMNKLTKTTKKPPTRAMMF